MQHELTWVVLIIGAVMGFVVNVILPLQKVQIQLTQIQIDIAQSKEDYKAAMIEHIALRSRVDVLETRVNTVKR